MAAHKLKQFLDENKVQYESIAHEPSYTAQGIAHSAHLSGKELAKTVILKADGRLVMAVLPGNEKVNLDEFKRSVGAQEVVLAEEPDFLDTFPGCELGAMPPFGNLWDVPVYVAEDLAEHDQIAFNAGTHVELIKMAYADFERLVKPTVVTLSHPVG